NPGVNNTTVGGIRTPQSLSSVITVFDGSYETCGARYCNLDHHGAKFAYRRGIHMSFYSQVNVENPNNMLPKSRRALTIQEIAALARSSLHGISQVVKDHVTKPTAMAQGRVAHLIEWKGWCKPTDTPGALESDFNSYSDLSEGEQEARFAADLSSYPHYLRDLLHTQVCQAHLQSRGLYEVESGVGVDLSPPVGSPGSPGSPSDTLCSSMCSLDERHPLLRDLSHRGDTPAADLAAKILRVLHGGEEVLLARLQRAGHRPGHSPCCLATYSETFEEEDTPCKDCGGGVCCQPEYSTRRKVSDVASSGVVSLDEEDEDEGAEEVEEEEREP
ncbi:hypothetical protein P4O66_017890, partial [Electrophorus voltai]